MTDQQLPIANALVSWLDPQLASLSLAEHRLDLSTAAHPRYPANALTDCPRLLLRAYKGDIKALANQGVRWDYVFSYWLYMRDVTQAQILAALATIEGCFLAQFNPPSLSAAGTEYIAPVQVVTHDEMPHPLGEKRLRVYPGEILIGAVARKH